MSNEAYPLGKNDEVYDIKAQAALLGIRKTLAFSKARFASN